MGLRAQLWGSEGLCTLLLKYKMIFREECNLITNIYIYSYILISEDLRCFSVFLHLCLHLQIYLRKKTCISQVFVWFCWHGSAQQIWFCTNPVSKLATAWHFLYRTSGHACRRCQSNWPMFEQAESPKHTIWCTYKLWVCLISPHLGIIDSYSNLEMKVVQG